MCVFCKQRSLSPEHDADTIVPDPFSAPLPVEPDTIRLVVNNDDSAPDSIETTNSMDVGDTFQGEINVGGDEDWIAIDLTATQTIQIDMSGLQDNRIGLYGPGGSLITLLREDTLTQYIDETGTYYIKAESIFAFNETGTYQVTVTDVSPFPAVFSSPMRSIDWGSQVEGQTITYYFAPDGYLYDDGFDRLTGDTWLFHERQQVRKAMDRIESMVDLTFVETNSSAADFVLIVDVDEVFEFLGYFNPPGEAFAGIGVFNASLWDRSPGGSLEEGGRGFGTITHELLHGLGLAHPHDRGGTSSQMRGVGSDFDDTGTYLLNQGIFTTMTYNEGFYEGPVGTASFARTYGTEAGPMALDVAVLQRKYGANTTTAAGDDIYDLPEANGIGTYYETIWDTGGSDMLRYGGTRNTTLDLRAATLENEEGGGGYVSAADGIAGGYTISFGVEIEHAESGSGADLLRGNDLANQLSSGAGHDTVTAYKGDDTIEAGAGNDDVSGLGGNDSILGEAGNDTLRGGRESDTILGGDGTDQLRGQREGDLLDGGNGFDNIKGGGGNDTLLGGNGNDFLKGGTRRDEISGGGGDDTLLGNSFTDTLEGGAGADVLNGGGDNDRLDGGTGSDVLKGGDGADVFVFDLGHGNDLIQDMDLGRDRLELSEALAAGRDAADLAAAAQVQGGGCAFGSGRRRSDPV